MQANKADCVSVRFLLIGLADVGHDVATLSHPSSLPHSALPRRPRPARIPPPQPPSGTYVCRVPNERRRQGVLRRHSRGQYFRKMASISVRAPAMRSAKPSSWEPRLLSASTLPTALMPTSVRTGGVVWTCAISGWRRGSFHRCARSGKRLFKPVVGKRLGARRPRVHRCARGHQG